MNSFSKLLVAGAFAAASAGAASAATVTAAGVGITGTYGLGDDLNIDGHLNAFWDDLNAVRDYSLNVFASIDGLDLVSEVIPLSDMIGAFSINGLASMIRDEIDDTGFGDELDLALAFLMNNDSASFGPFSYSYEVTEITSQSFGADFDLAFADICENLGACSPFDFYEGTFAVGATLTYDGDLGPVPLPAGLPLLLAGLGGLGVLRHRRKSRA